MNGIGMIYERYRDYTGKIAKGIWTMHGRFMNDIVTVQCTGTSYERHRDYTGMM